MLVLCSTYSYVTFLLNIRGIYEGIVFKKSIFRPLYETLPTAHNRFEPMTMTTTPAPSPAVVGTWSAPHPIPMAFVPPVPRVLAHRSREKIRRHFTVFSPSPLQSRATGGPWPSPLSAAKRSQNYEDSENQWYDDVDDNASSADVFWGEMERRRSLNQSEVNGSGLSPIDMVGMANDMDMDSAITPQAAATAPVEGRGGMNFGVPEKLDADATLSSYSAFAVPDNYLYQDYDDGVPAGLLRNDPSLWEGEDLTLEEENAELNRQLDEWELELGDGSVVGESSPSPSFDPSFVSDEPWDRYDQEEGNTRGDFGKPPFQDKLKRRMNMVSERAKEFTLHPEEAGAEAAREEEDHVRSLASIGIKSRRLENAAVNPKAKAYFQRPPDKQQGFDAMWVSTFNAPLKVYHECYVSMK